MKKCQVILKKTLINIKTLLDSMGVSMDDVFKCTCILEDIKDFSKMSEIYTTFFKKKKKPARTTFAASGLAAGAKLEIECMALMRSDQCLFIKCFQEFTE